MKRYHGMCKYQQIKFFPNVVKDVRPTYSNKEELAPLKSFGDINALFMRQFNYESH